MIVKYGENGRYPEARKGKRPIGAEVKQPSLSHTQFIKEWKELRRIYSKYCISKQEVKEAIGIFEKNHFEEDSDPPSMPIHHSDFIALKKELGL